MFNKKEGSLLKTLISKEIDQLRGSLESITEQAERETAENELISLVTIYNKLKRDILNQQDNKLAHAMPRVLLVDDVESMREVAKKMLSELGFRKVDEARNAEIALKMLDKAYIEGQPYKLVITDWEMPGKSGLDLLKDIRINENISEADVFLLTSHGAQKNIVQAINAGVTGYLVKPINFITLQKKFGKYLAHIEKPAMA